MFGSSWMQWDWALVALSCRGAKGICPAIDTARCRRWCGLPRASCPSTAEWGCLGQWHSLERHLKDSVFCWRWFRWVEYNARYHNYSLLMKAFQTTAFQFPERMQHIIYTRYTHIAKEPKADVFPPELEGLLKGTINSRICFLYTNRTPENNDQSEVIMSKFCMTFALPIAFPRQVVHCHKPPYSGIPGGNGGFAGLAGSWIFRDCQRCNCNGWSVNWIFWRLELIPSPLQFWR